MTQLNTLKQKLAVAGTVIVLSGIGISTVMIQPTKTGAQTSPLVTEVDNHETRIKNAENNIKDLQVKTNTPESSSNTSVPVVTTPVVSGGSVAGDTSSPASTVETPAVALVVVTAYREIVIDADTSDCEYTYSDGTTYQFHWKTSDPKGSWVTDGVGQNGKWVKTSQETGFCDKRAIGLLKG